MSKFIISVLAVFMVLTCNVSEPNIDSPNAVLVPKPTAPNIVRLTSKSVVWKEQNINKYSFIEKFSVTTYPAGYLAKVTIIDDYVTEIEMLEPGFYMTEEHRILAEERIKSFGSISSIYEQFLAWNEETLKTLEKNQKIDFDIKYNETYNFPEYLKYGVYTYKYIGDNCWASRLGEGSVIVEISAFTILE